jgi:hypothetical protein
MAEPLRSPDARQERSPNRRRRSSASDEESIAYKYHRTGTRLDVTLPYPRKPEREPLCKRCRDLNLSRRIDSRERIAAKGHFLTYLDWDEDAGCTLCDFLKTMRLPPSAQSKGKLQQPGYHLRAFSGMLSYCEYFSRASQHPRRYSGDTMLAVVPNGLFSDKKGQERYAETFGRVGYILPTASSSTAPWLTGRLVRPLRIDFPAIQAWFQFCRKNHSCSMRYSRPDKLQVIDCNTMKIVAAPSNCNYFALSYVWGSTAGVNPPSSEPELLDDLPPVAKDAISVVRSLGKRYLWVDRYCVPQTDLQLKSEHIQRMDLIYEGAFCTIIAAAGSDDQYGLPGISRPRRTQPLCHIGDESFVSTLPDPQQSIRESTWMTRAWTYQEAFCSNRRLIFTEDQVYFECNVMHCREAVDIPLNHLHSHDRKTALDSIRPVLFGNEWMQGTHRFGALSAYWNVVKQYSARRMTYDSDALNALNGILRRFQASPSFVYNILGIPVHASPESEKSALLDPNVFLPGLAWSHINPPRRRVGFPSWTWAGWEGAIHLQHTFGSTGYESSVKLCVEEEGGEEIEWAQFWDGFWVPAKKAQWLERMSLLVMDADVFKVQLVVHEGRTTEAKPRIDLLNPYSGVELATITLPVDLIEEARRKTDLWDCVVLGRKPKSVGPDVMLIRWSLDVAERIWAGTISEGRSYDVSRKSCLPPTLRKRIRLM